MMGRAGAGLICENNIMTLSQADFCALPSYLVLRVKHGAQSWGDLRPDAAQRIGALLARATQSIEDVTGADRVYCLSFCEVDRNLHFHLMPRTPQLLREYQAATGTVDRPVNGPLLFEWAREAYPAERVTAALAEVCAQLRACFDTNEFSSP